MYMYMKYSNFPKMAEKFSEFLHKHVYIHAHAHTYMKKSSTQCQMYMYMYMYMCILICSIYYMYMYILFVFLPKCQIGCFMILKLGLPYRFEIQLGIIHPSHGCYIARKNPVINKLFRSRSSYPRNF